ncbi:hypothetical protein TDB9533_01221 [Thalassocella blandensis]|nr:hypothetical protein TDB9533_01221 [Thalassocella blandensis]
MITEAQQATINEALNILHNTLIRGVEFNNSTTVKDFLALELALLQQEVFAVLFLDSQHRLISFEKMFFGTINAAAVYPREVVRKALELNAAAVIFGHNHPSGNSEPSRADIAITRNLTTILNIIDVQVLDHVVVSPIDQTSMSESGLI